MNRAMTLPAITAEKLVREFGAGTRAVDGIDLEVFPGEIYGFLGPNGAGKSTTVLMLTTLLPATGGKATVGGFDIARQGPQVRAAIGAALQEASLDVMLTGREHLRFQATLRGIGKATAAERTAELLDRVGLTEAADRRVGGYSGGMKRRLDLAMALVHQPAILFLDEPTTGLDLQSRAGLWDEVARLARDDGATVFLTTQYLEEADVLADRVGIIDHGKIVAEGTPARLKAELGPPTVEIRPAERDTLDAMSRALERFAAPVRNETGTLTVPLPEGERQLAELVRALDQASLRIAALQLHRRHRGRARGRQRHRHRRTARPRPPCQPHRRPLGLRHRHAAANRAGRRPHPAPRLRAAVPCARLRPRRAPHRLDPRHCPDQPRHPGPRSRTRTPSRNARRPRALVLDPRCGNRRNGNLGTPGTLLS